MNFLCNEEGLYSLKKLYFTRNWGEEGEVRDQLKIENVQKKNLLLRSKNRSRISWH